MTETNLIGEQVLSGMSPAEAAYDALAPYYDRFTAHHDYGLWTDRIRELLHRHGLRGRRLLDVACGTGKSFEPFLADHEVTAVDLSARMVERAVRRADGRARVLRADMRTLPDLGAFDLVLALDDAINYLLDRRDLERALARLHAQLAPGGLLAFDVNLLYSYRTFFAAPSVVAGDDVLLAWDGRTPPRAGPGVLARATLHAFARDGGGWRRAVSEHVQRHWPLPALHASLARSNLRVLGLYGQHVDARFVAGPDELAHTKAFVVACRDDDPRPGERR
jgi:SAM-dependent methyltransferase